MGDRTEQRFITFPPGSIQVLRHFLYDFLLSIITIPWGMSSCQLSRLLIVKYNFDRGKIVLRSRRMLLFEKLFKLTSYRRAMDFRRWKFNRSLMQFVSPLLDHFAFSRYFISKQKLYIYIFHFIIYHGAVYFTNTKYCFILILNAMF